MKVLFFIFVSEGGRGGHYHSLNHITRTLGTTDCKIDILTIGNQTSEIIAENPHFRKHLYFNRDNFINFFKQLYLEIQNNKPDILHFFDTQSYSLCFPLTFFFDSKVVLTKCGGANSPKLYPIVPNLILFTEENRKWFVSKNQYKNTRIEVIPNRVNVLKIEKNEDYQKDPEYFSFVRICRIGKEYCNSILNGINLVKELNQSSDFKTKLYVIGKVTDDEIYSILLEAAKGYDIEFITDNRIALEASRMLYLADAVIGTGRSALEALSLGLPLLVPSGQINFPILFDENNRIEIMQKNFTERAEFGKLSHLDELKKIELLITDNKYYSTMLNYSKAIFNEFYDVHGIKSNYINFYKNANFTKLTFEGLLVNIKSTLSTIVTMFKNKYK